MPARATDARRAAVLGSPIAHSLSPVLHRAAYRELGLGAWTYDRFEIDEAALPAFVEGLGQEWAGLSLTMPLKRAVMPLLDEISETAASVEAVNTVVFTEDGRRVGDNTDIPGMVAALRERGIEQVDSAAVLGATPPPPPHWPPSPGSAPVRSSRTYEAGSGPPRCGSGASASVSRCAPRTGATPNRRCGRRW